MELAFRGQVCRLERIRRPCGYDELPRFSLSYFLFRLDSRLRQNGSRRPTAPRRRLQKLPDPKSTLVPKSNITHASIPLRFEPNQGQADPSVQFITRGAGYSLALSANGAVISLPQQPAETDPYLARLNAKTRKRFEARKFYHFSARFHRPKKTQTVRLTVANADSGATPEPFDPLRSKSNYFIGNDPNLWRTGIPNYGRVRYAGIYPGVDLLYYGNEGHLEFDFVVSPGSDPSSITLESNQPLRISRDGQLMLGSGSGTALLRKPSIYQVEDGRKRPVQGGFLARENGRVGIRVASYDRQRPLIIDPVLTYSTYLGGNSTDSINGVAVDSAGNAYVVGATTSSNFPTHNGYPSVEIENQIAFVSKFDSTGSNLLYSTYPRRHRR